MKNPFSKCRKIRQRLRRHKLTAQSASDYGAFHWNGSVFGESYSKKQSHDECSEATAQRQNSPREKLLSITASDETCFNSREDFISNLDLEISSASGKEFTYEVKEKNSFLLNILYADEFEEDEILLEIMIILSAIKKNFKELHKDNENIYDQDRNVHELQEWADIMSEKIYGSKTQTFIAWQGRIPGPVGRPVIGGSTMHKWLQKKTQ